MSRFFFFRLSIFPITSNACDLFNKVVAMSSAYAKRFPKIVIFVRILESLKAMSTTNASSLGLIGEPYITPVYTIYAYNKCLLSSLLITDDQFDTMSDGFTFPFCDQS